LDQLCAKYGLALDQIAHLGDDLPDLPLLRRVGLACCPHPADLSQTRSRKKCKPWCSNGLHTTQAT
jgi:3-deoxy-D-manno-octulosonate 8-phosphate phosphatase KdsC-like HAD superfamily phosphatase